MTRAPRLSARMKALTEAAQIAEAATRSFRETMSHRRPADRLGSATDAAAANACESVAYLIRERMQARRTR